MREQTTEQTQQVVVAFRLHAAQAARLDALAASGGISRADAARRATLRDLAARATADG